MSASEELFSCAGLRFGRFRCEPRDPLWGDDNRIGPWPLIAFPGTPVEILQADRPAIVATPLCVVLYNAEQVYRRRLVDHRGDHCAFLSFDPRHLGESDDKRPFGLSCAPLAPRDRLSQLLLLRLVSAPWDLEEPLLMIESLLALLDRVLHTRRTATTTEEPPRILARHRGLARAIARHLAQTFDRREGLGEIAAAVGVSSAHAARVFRRILGRTIHDYRSALRLHAILDRLADPRLDLSAAALDAGFSSHSHMTSTFRQVFGAPPSIWRERLRRGDTQALRELLMPRPA